MVVRERLVRIELIPPGPRGATCPEGGVAIVSGRDFDIDGVLDDVEIEAREVLCSPATVVREVAIPPGPVCVGGGFEILRGHDHDGDGALDDDELEVALTLCDPSAVWRGTLDLARPDDREILRTARAVVGSVHLTGDTAIEAGQLEEVTGDIVQTAGAALTAPALVAVGGSLRLASGGLTAPLLAAVGGELRSVGGAGELSLPALAEVRGPIAIVDGAVTRIALPALQIASRVELRAVPALTAIQAPRLARIDDGTIEDAPALTAATLHPTAEIGALVLRRVGFGELSWLAGARIDHLQVSDSAALAGFGAYRPTRLDSLALRDLPSLASLAGLEPLRALSGDLVIARNPQLGSLAGLAGLIALGGALEIVDNPALPAAEIAALRARLGL